MKKIVLSRTTSSLVGLYVYGNAGRAARRHSRGVVWVITGLGCERSQVQIPRETPIFEGVSIGWDRLEHHGKGATSGNLTEKGGGRKGMKSWCEKRKIQPLYLDISLKYITALIYPLTSTWIRFLFVCFVYHASFSYFKVNRYTYK